MTTIEKRFEEADENYIPQLTGHKNMPTATIATTLTRAQMVAAIKLRDPTFVDSVDAYSDSYISGRYSGAIAMQPVVGVAKSNAAAVVKTDESELSPVTKAMIALEAERDRVRGAVSSIAPTKRLDDADHEGFSDVTKAMIAAHDRDEAARRNGGGNDAA